MSGFDEVAWFPLCAGLTGIGLVASWLAWRRRGVAAGLRGAAWSLLPLAAYLTGAVEMLWRIGTAVADWVAGFVFSPRVWSGVIVVGLAVLLYLVSGAPPRDRLIEPAGSDQAGLVGKDDQLRAVACVELHHGAAHVGLGRRRADHQSLGDLLVRQPARDQRHHLPLPVGQRVQLWRRPGLLGVRRELRDQPPGDARGQQRVATRDRPD